MRLLDVRCPHSKTNSLLRDVASFDVLLLAWLQADDHPPFPRLGFEI